MQSMSFFFIKQATAIKTNQASDLKHLFSICFVDHVVWKQKLVIFQCSILLSLIGSVLRQGRTSTALCSWWLLQWCRLC